MPTIRTSDGVALRTQSHRRFVVFAITDDSRVGVLKRSDSLQTAADHFNKVARRHCRVVLVDFHPSPLATTQPARITKDTADAS